jgi:superfamily II DNA/RNA helicase
MDKVELVTRLLQARGRGATMIFTRTKRTAQKVSDDLAERGFKVDAVHGDLGQGAREKALKSFRAGSVDVLVATDVAARGIDIDDVTHVINYQCPDDEHAYVHRIGRTGRAGRTGVAITLVDWDELPKWTAIDKALSLDCPNPAETYSSSPHLYEELDIPTDVTGIVGQPKKQPAKRPARTEAGAGNGDGVAARTDKPRTRNRERQRTRGAKTATGHVQGSSEAAGAAGVALADAEDGQASDPARRRRRRRPRKTAEAAPGAAVSAG